MSKDRASHAGQTVGYVKLGRRGQGLGVFHFGARSVVADPSTARLHSGGAGHPASIVVSAPASCGHQYVEQTSAHLRGRHVGRNVPIRVRDQPRGLPTNHHKGPGVHNNSFMYPQSFREIIRAGLERCCWEELRRLRDPRDQDVHVLHGRSWSLRSAVESVKASLTYGISENIMMERAVAICSPLLVETNGGQFISFHLRRLSTSIWSMECRWKKNSIAKPVCGCVGMFETATRN